MHKDIAIGIVLATLFLVALTLFFGVLIKLYVHKIKAYTRLIFEKDLAHQKALTVSVIETQEQVLDNISRDLHDDAGQQLTFINFQIENLKYDSPVMAEALEPVSDSIKRLSESIRSISHSLNNQVLLQKDLMKSIKAELDRIAKQSSFKVVSNICCDAAQPFSTDEKIVIYRIFQENINNILKHSQARNVWVTITDAPFTMAISDDGRGFDPASAHDESIGLANMRARAAIIGYEINLRSAPGNGTTITLQAS